MMAAFRRGQQEFGDVERQNVVIEYRCAEGRINRPAWDGGRSGGTSGGRISRIHHYAARPRRRGNRMNCVASMIDPLRQWFNLNLGQPAPTSLGLSVSRQEFRAMRVAFVCNPTRLLLPLLNLWLKQAR